MPMRLILSDNVHLNAQRPWTGGPGVSHTTHPPLFREAAIIEGFEHGEEANIEAPETV